MRVSTYLKRQESSDEDDSEDEDDDDDERVPYKRRSLVSKSRPEAKKSPQKSKKVKPKSDEDEESEEDEEEKEQLMLSIADVKVSRGKLCTGFCTNLIHSYFIINWTIWTPLGRANMMLQ